MPTPNYQPNKQTASTPSHRQQTKRASDTKTADKDKNKRRNTFITAVSIFVVIILVISIAYYLIYVMPFQRVIIKVDNDVVKIDYLLKRALNSTSDDPLGISFLDTLVYELIIMQEAPKNGINVTDQDIDTYLHDMAKGDSESITDDEYKEWYRQLLNNTQYSNTELRNLVKLTLYQQRMFQLIADNTPTITEQWHLWVIIVKTYEEAVSVQERAANGEEFASLARELSLDTTAKENGGDIGWFPWDYLDTNVQSILAGLDIGECSAPINNNPGADMNDVEAQSFALYMISEKDVAREVPPEQLDTLKANAYKSWLNAQSEKRVIEYHGIHGGSYDSTTQAWLYYQLQRMAKGKTSSSTE
jgi:foldase protein PrsA